MNPRACQETELQFQPVARKKKLAVVGAGPVGSATTLGAPVASSPIAASAPPEGPVSPTVGGGGSPLDSFLVPGLIVGVPAIIILGIIAAQLAVGAAWMPVIRRWLNRRDDSRPLLDQSQDDGPSQQVQPCRPDVP